MGAVAFDLTGAQMTGDEAELEVSVAMGGIELRIPETWALDVRLTPVLGGVDDRTRPPAVPAKRLVLDGTVFMGGIEVRN